MPQIHVTDAGIVFTGTNSPAQASGSPTSNVLDDYEEGTWTPGMPVTTSNADSSYVLIGKMIFLNIFIDVNGTSNSNSGSDISGFPFTVGNVNWNYANHYCMCDNLNTAYNNISIQPAVSGTTGAILQDASGSTTQHSAVAASRFTTGTDLRSAPYYTI